MQFLPTLKRLSTRFRIKKYFLSSKKKILQNKRLVTWLNAYFWQPCVVFKDHPSSRLPDDSGVPRGSVLGLLLLLIFINDIVRDIPVKIKLFDHDCVLYSTVKNSADQILLNEAFQKVCAWCKAWKKSINKTAFMKIRKKNPVAFAYTANNVHLSDVT